MFEHFYAFLRTGVLQLLSARTCFVKVSISGGVRDNISRVRSMVCALPLRLVARAYVGGGAA